LSDILNASTTSAWLVVRHCYRTGFTGASDGLKLGHFSEKKELFFSPASLGDG